MFSLLAENSLLVPPRYFRPLPHLGRNFVGGGANVAFCPWLHANTFQIAPSFVANFAKTDHFPNPFPFVIAFAMATSTQTAEVMTTVITAWVAEFPQWRNFGNLEVFPSSECHFHSHRLSFHDFLQNVFCILASKLILPRIEVG